MQDLIIILIQSDLDWENPEANLQQFDEKIENLDTNPDLIVLPEMFNTGFTMNVEKCAEKIGGKSFLWLKEKSKQLNCVITASLLIEEDGKFYNRLIWMKPNGDYEFYNKRHLFRMAKEHQVMTAGRERKIVEINGWKINLQVCYDLRFPVWSKNNFTNGQHDFDILLYIANWPEVRNYAYKTLLLARAMENQAYVIWVNRVGQDGNKINHTGDSMIVDPIGKILTQAAENEKQVLRVHIPSNKIAEYREKFKVGLDWDRFSVID